MTSVEYVKQLCKERHIPISRLERDLGWSNAYVAQLRKGSFPADRAVQVAEYLSISLSALLNPDDPETKESPPANDREAEDREFMELYQDAPEDIRTAVLTILKNGAGR